MNTATNSGGGQTRWSLRLLGGCELRVLPGGERLALPGKRERLLLAYLSLSPNHRQSRRKLATLLWGDAADETTLDNLRTCMWRLRKALDDTEHRLISSEGEDIVLNIGAFDIDVLAFRRLAAETGRVGLEAAASLYAGEFLDGFEIESEEFEHWRRTEGARYRDLAIEVLVRLMTLLDEGGKTERAAETGLQILGLDPLHETAVRGVMRLYGRSGRRGAAIQLYQSLANTLKAELDSEPELETKRLFAEFSRVGKDPADDSHDAGAEPRSSASTAFWPGPETDRASRRATPPALWSRASIATLAGALILAAAFFSYLRLADPSNATGTAPATRVISLAVLPFANLSGDASQEFFSYGMTEEITSALAKIPHLTVVGRSSAFQFKGQNQDLRVVGQSLNATHLLEGSVRKEGDRVRVTAQLVLAENGMTLWRESYDRQLAGVFTIQEEIAQAIAASLRVPLGIEPGENLVNNRNIDPESYEKYLRGKTLFEARGGVPAGSQDQNLTQAAAVLEDAVAKNPAYGPAWAALGGTYYGLAQNGSNAADISYARRAADAFRIKGEAAGQKAVELDASLSEAYGVLAVFTWSRGKTVEAAKLYEKAMALDPADPNALGGYAIRLATAGRLKEALDLAERALRADPFYPNVLAETAQDRWLNGQSESAIALAKTLRPNDRARLLTLMYASMHRFGDAADALMELAAGDAQSDVAKAADLLRMAPAKAPPVELPRLPPALSMLYLYLGAPERALQLYDRMVEVGFMYGNRSAVWHPDYAPVRNTERFKELMKDTGLVDYWRAKGWPDLCHPTTGDDFECN